MPNSKERTSLASEPASAVRGHDVRGTPQKRQEPKDIVLFVHGTFAFNENDEALPGKGGRWWQRGSDFASGLEQACGLRIVPSGERVSAAAYPWFWWRRKPTVQAKNNQDSELVFHWSGANSENYRRIAGQRLYEHFERVAKICARDHCDFHVVGHSHGGSVLFEALRRVCLATEKDKSESSAGTLINRHLTTWTTVATPFLSFGADWGRLPWFLIFLAGLLLLAWRQYGWWWDFWNQHGVPEAYCPGTTFLWYLAGHASLVMFAMLVCLIPWLWWNASRSGNQQSDQREQSRIDVVSALLTAAVFAVAAGCLYFGAGAELRETFWIETLDGGVVLANLLTTAFAVALALCLWQIWSVFACRRQERRRAGEAGRTWKAFRSRHAALPVGFEMWDEAVNGLRALRFKPRVEVLPRWSAPGQDRYVNHRSKQPEWEIDQQKLVPWALRYALLPFRIVLDWIVRPFYNEVFARIVDDYLVTRLWRSAVGCDLTCAKIVDCSPLPVAASLGPYQEHPADTLLAMEQTRQYVAQGTEHLLVRVRRLLCGDFPDGLRLTKLFRRAMAGSGDESGYLNHTGYFHTGPVASPPREMVKALAARYNQPSLQPAPPTQPPAAEAEMVDDGAQTGSVQLDFLAAWARFATRSAVVLSPVAALAVVGFLVLYPYSLDNLLAATELTVAPRQCLLAVLDTATPDDNESYGDRIVLATYLATLPARFVKRTGLLNTEEGYSSSLTLLRLDYAVELCRHDRLREGVAELTAIDQRPGEFFKDTARRDYYLAALAVAKNCLSKFAASRRLRDSLEALRTKRAPVGGGRTTSKSAQAHGQKTRTNGGALTVSWSPALTRGEREKASDLAWLTLRVSVPLLGVNSPLEHNRTDGPEANSGADSYLKYMDEARSIEAEWQATCTTNKNPLIASFFKDAYLKRFKQCTLSLPQISDPNEALRVATAVRLRFKNIPVCDSAN